MRALKQNSLSCWRFLHFKFGLLTASLERSMKRVLALIAFVFLTVGLVYPVSAESVSIVIATNASPRMQFGAEKLVEALKAVKLDSTIVRTEPKTGPRIYVSEPHQTGSSSEGFWLNQ